MNASNFNKLFLSFTIIAIAACSPAEQGAGNGRGLTDDSIALESTNWQLVQLTVAGGFVFTPDDPSKYVLNFRSENRLTGTSDCNQITGIWIHDGAALHFDPFSSTRSLCPPGSLHNNLVLHLRDVVALDYQGGHLLLSTNTSGVELEFEARD